ncbi:class I tRNA ligase family protein [Nocardia asteroides]|uniref:class I tRNA ligase family protein n=1 Tax=Nocardia asteroides TaxID=1824 RepID=UPI001E4C6524|nr:class I tRNA ligase family protein [Nocardia asteroides]UGT59859.1 class I tRNA ligase family protein [Nocardia asteroides]
MADWLLIPMCPTPNGRLHIGHGAGPYLRADAIARALRRDGHTAAIITGTDAYENWVLAATSSDRTPEQTCREYHTGIEHDLRALGVELDQWIDPLADEHRGPYRKLHEHLLATLRASGAARQGVERIPVGAESGRQLLGVWIAGRCPTCDAPAGGNTCTTCGDHFHPDELRDPYSRLTDEPIRWDDQLSWFAYPDDPDRVIDRLRATGLAEQFLTAPHTYLQRSTARIRLTQPGSWGITSDHLEPGTVLANTYYAYSLYCGQLHHRTSGNAFAPNSATTVVGLFGTDNSIAGLVAPQILAAPAGLKPFDHTVINHMVHFEGRKCSTSKQHGIWISDLIDNTSITTDELRYALAQIPLDHYVGDIDLPLLTEQVNELRKWHNRRLETALGSIRATTLGSTDFELIAGQLDRQRHSLQPPHVDLTEATAIARAWMLTEALNTDDPHEATVWLTGTALLITPLLPQMAETLWAALGLGRRISLASLRDQQVQPTPGAPNAAASTSLATVSEIAPYARHSR